LNSTANGGNNSYFFVIIAAQAGAGPGFAHDDIFVTEALADAAGMAITGM
jgi:hypothetical protein